MSITYTPITDFLTKDTLPKEDPDKVILGADFDAEFQAISLSFTEAAPTVSPTFTGVATFADLDCTTMDASGNATVGGTFNVTGATTLGGLTAGASALGNTTVGTLDTSGNATVTGTLAVTGAVTSGGSLLTTTDNVNDLIALAELGIIAELDDLSNVDEAGKIDGSALVWNAGSSQWEPTALSAAPSVELTASGAIAAGDALIVNADGTTSAVTGVNSAVHPQVDFDPSNRPFSFYSTFAYEDVSGNIVAGFQDGATSNGSVIIGDITGNSVTFGAITAVDTSASNVVVSAAPGTGKVLVVYHDSTLGLQMRVGTVSGTGITFGTVVSLASHNPSYSIGIAWSPDNSCFLVTYLDSSSGSGALLGTVVTISGTTPVVGSTTTIESIGNARQSRVTYDTANDHFVVAYNYNSDINSAVVTVSGTTPTAGADVEFEPTSGSKDLADMSYDPAAGLHVILYQSNGTSTGRLGLIDTSSGSPTYPASSVEIVGESINHDYSCIEYASDIGRHVVFYRTFGSVIPPDFTTITIDGTDIITDSPTPAPVYTVDSGLGYDPVNNRALVLADNNEESKGTAFVFTPGSSNMTQGNFIGFSGEAYADASLAKVQLTGSVNTHQTGLTAGLKYHVTSDGSLSTTETSTSSFAGVAISATSLIVKG